MDVKTICLGLLSLGEACGYELKKNFESLFRHFFSAGYGSIYPALADLADAGLVTCREVPQDGRPARKVYSITDAGREHFGQAMRSQDPAHKLRSDFLVMMYFADQLDQHRLGHLLDDRIAQFREAAGDMQTPAEQNGSGQSGRARFVAGFAQALANTAAQYIEDHRDLLESEARATQNGSYLKKNAHEVALNLEERL